MRLDRFRPTIGNVILLAIGLRPVEAAAQAPARDSLGIMTASRAVRSMRAVRRTSAISIDGRIDEQAWTSAPIAAQFTQSYPHPGALPIDSTAVRVVYDDDALYVGIRMYDAHPDSIAAQLAPRDASGIYSDWVHLIIDSYHDRRTAFRFSVNPRGVEKDVYTFDDGREDVNWDAVWQVGARIDSTGWVAEYRIPFSQLRYGPSREHGDRIWGIQIMRDIARRDERDSWSTWTPQSPGFVSDFGDLSGLADLPATTHIQFLPYLSSRLTRAPGTSANPFYHASDVKESFGADLRSSLPGGLMLTATANPDFGQVEADPAVVNLTAFESFFPEKRPFFLEGSDIFSFGQVQQQKDFGSQYFFYSRRIGRAPELAPAGNDIVYASEPEQTSIAGAGKVTGQAGPWTVGILDAVTTQASARVQTRHGVLEGIPVEPQANYFAGRLKREFGNGSSFIGGMVTSTTRAMSDSVFDPVIRSNAIFGGADFEHSMSHRNWILSGFVAGSRVNGRQRAIERSQENSTHNFQRPDAAYLVDDSTRTSLTGHIGELAIERLGTVLGSVAYKEVSPGFEINDVGFIGRADYRALSSLVGYQDYAAGSHVRSFVVTASSNGAWNFGGRSIERAAATTATLTFSNLWSASLSGSRTLSAYDDRLLRGGPIALSPPGWGGSGSIGTDSRWPVIVTLNGSYQRDQAGTENLSAGIGFDGRPATTIHITVTPTWSVAQSTAQYIQTVTDQRSPTYGARYVFANLHQATLDIQTRLEWTLTTSLSVRTYLQPFASSGKYSQFKEFLQPGAYRFAVYGKDRGTIASSTSPTTFTVDPDGNGPSTPFTISDADFDVRSLRGNAVLRWDYRPGSTIFVVWQQQRADYDTTGAFAVGHDVAAIFRTVPTNILLVKATYWVGR